MGTLGVHAATVSIKTLTTLGLASDMIGCYFLVACGQRRTLWGRGVSSWTVRSFVYQTIVA